MHPIALHAPLKRFTGNKLGARPHGYKHINNTHSKLTHCLMRFNGELADFKHVREHRDAPMRRYITQGIKGGMHGGGRGIVGVIKDHRVFDTFQNMQAARQCLVPLQRANRFQHIDAKIPPHPNSGRGNIQLLLSERAREPQWHAGTLIIHLTPHASRNLKTHRAFFRVQRILGDTNVRSLAKSECNNFSPCLIPHVVYHLIIRVQQYQTRG